jgi:hypothetical protein
VAVLEIQVSNPSTMGATLTGMTLSAGGSGADDAGISGVEIWLDANENGMVDAGESLLGSGVYPVNNGTAVIVFTLPVGAGESVHLLVRDDFSATAPPGSYQAGLNAGGMNGTSPSGAITTTGLPLTGAIINIVQATATPTSSYTAIPSATPTGTFTRTPTPIPTATRTSTPMPTNTSVPTATCTETPIPTETFTPTVSETPTFTHTVTLTVTATEQPGNDKPVIYPNPSDGTKPVSIHLPGRTGSADIKVQIFTVAFRLVQQEVFQQIPSGTDIPIELKDKNGTPLASGLYYVVVTIDGKKLVSKLLILR